MADEPDASQASVRVSISFPLWVCVRKDNPDSLMGGKIAGGVPFVAVFTERKRAEQFLINVKKAEEGEIYQIPNEENFINFLETLKEDGVVQIVFNDEGFGGDVQWNAIIDSILGDLRG